MTPSVHNGPGPRVTFLGAAQTVTGSMHLVEVGSQRLLLDCGLFIGPPTLASQRNAQFPFDAGDIDAVLLSHAHIDHCGNLPNLVRQGFAGPIYCTAPTRDLLEIMLRDSARVQEADTDSMGESTMPTWSQPLYGQTDSARTLQQCITLAYGQPCSIGAGTQLQLHDAGHILGSAMIELRMHTNGRDTSLTYTGDLGRRGLPFLHPPAALPPCDLVICESTYGGRHHPPLEQLAEAFAKVVERTIARGGKVLVPAFSLGRAQIVVHYLLHWMAEGRFPALPLFADSPMIADIVAVYRRHPEYVRPGVAALLNDASGNGCHTGVHYVRSRAESMALMDHPGPCIIVASGGMLDAGRALHHLQHLIDDPRCSIVLVSYQSPQSLGRRLLERGPTVHFVGKRWNKWADIVELSGFSGHADQQDFLNALEPLASRAPQVQLVHGEVDQAQALAQRLGQRGFGVVGIPASGAVVTLG